MKSKVIGYKIVKADTTHLDEIAELWVELMSIHKEFDAAFFKDTESNKKNIKATFEHFLTNSNSLLLVLIVEEKVKGFVTASNNWIKYSNYNSVHSCEIGDIMIDKKFRKEGLGKQLIDGVKDWAREKDIHTIELNVFAKNSSGIDFFKGAGLKERFKILYIDF